MSFKTNKDLRLLLHPYAFVLKSGKDLNKNLLDYNLMILQMNCPETIRSPSYIPKVKLTPCKTYNLAKKPPVVPKPKRVLLDNV